MRHVPRRNSGGARKLRLMSFVASWSRLTSGEIGLASRSDRILLTGSAGFTGRPLAERLRNDGHEVIGLAHHPSEAGQFRGDLRNADWIRSVVADIKPSVA